MNSDLEYIANSYSQLKVHGSPLKAVNVNSPSKRPPPLLPTRKKTSLAPQLISADTPEEPHRLCMNAVDLVLRRFSTIKSLSSSHLRLASCSFVQLYKGDLLSRKSEIVKKHQQFILKLIELEASLGTDFAMVVREIRCADTFGSHLEGGPLDFCSHTDTTLKFLALQVVFKMLQRGNFTYSEDVLRFFMQDKTFVASLSNSHKTMLIKLVLSMTRTSPTPQFKHCMNIKFLQYLTQFNLKFEQFITNMSRESFTEDIESAVLALDTFHQIPYFVLSYMVVDRSERLSNLAKKFEIMTQFASLDWQSVRVDSTASKSTLRLINIPNVNSELIRTELKAVNRPSKELLTGLGAYLVKSANDQEGVDMSLFQFFVKHVVELTGETNRVLDKVLMSLKSAKLSSEFVENVLSLLCELYLKFSDYKRLRNLSNLAFHLKHYFTSIKSETYMFLKNEKGSDLGYKFKKAVHLLSKTSKDLTGVIGLIFNNEIMDSMGYSRFLEKIEAFDKQFGSKKVLSNLSNLNMTELTEENRALVFMLATRYGHENLTDLFERLNITNPILHMACVVSYSDIRTVKNFKTTSTCITNADPLIKCFYYLALEKKNKSTTNVQKIHHMYLSSWVPRNKYPLTKFEIQFLKVFVDYLKFINYQKGLRQLLEAVEKYVAQSNHLFNDWLAFEKLENALNLKLIMKLSPADFDKEMEQRDFEVDVDSFVRSLSYKLLKLRYYLINFDHNQLEEVALDITKTVSFHCDVLSTDNKNHYQRDKFLDILILLLKLHQSRSKLMWVEGHHLECIVSAVSTIQLSKSILKNDPGNLQVLHRMASSFRNLINTLIHLGITKDADYYIGEFKKFNESVSHFKPLYAQNNYFITYFLHVAGRQEECESLKLATDEIFKSLQLLGEGESGDVYIDNYKLIYYRILSDIYFSNEEISWEARGNFRSFLTFVEKEGKLLANTWKMYYEYHFNSAAVDLTLNRSQNPYLNAMNYMLNSRRLFVNAQNSLNMDPLFSTLEDSAMSIPASVVHEELAPTPAPTPGKSKTKTVKNVKKAIIGMRQSKSMIMDLFPELQYLANYQRNELHRVMCLDLLTLSSISNYKNDNVRDCFMLNNHVKGQPFESEKFMVGVTKKSPNMIPDFSLSGLAPTVKFEEPDMTLVRKNNWQVISIDVSTLNDELIISRLDESPKMLKLPLTRLCVRTGEEPNFKLADCLSELAQIIKESDETMTTEATSIIDSPEARKQWHETRAALDERLYTLLCKIQHYWIGGFTSVFSPLKVTQEDLAEFKRRFLNIIRLNIPSRSQKAMSSNKNVEIDDFIVELFLKLGDPAKLVSTEPMEDLIYFVLDILLFHGEENAYDEVDIDNIYVQVEMLLTDFITANPSPEVYSHTVLLVGKELVKIPWESLPCLRSTPVSRIPSLNMLVDLLEKNQALLTSKKNGSIILNPAGDLMKTQERFEQPLKYLKDDLLWSAIVNEKPTEDIFKEALESNIAIYVGHGAGTAYIRETTVKGMDNIGPTLLLGCSSAALQSNSQLEANGTIYSYLIGGCPMIVGNLWDVTDKDIDKFSLSVFQKWGLSSSSEEKANISEAVALSRDECKLKYLNGAAAVVYGLPLSLV
ncbi:Separin [Cyberlindnera fabianii]|uniref:separase n=2 Tax=Cyberlindnera fabianii TaxID=36022 RepID=A0A1V2L195_CYBFA|nr:Separin [Cyberlindnera fabianii]